MDQHIEALKTQIDALSGSLALSRQLRMENEETLDTDRYWNLIRSQEAQGLQFQALVDDYLHFTEVNYEWFLWPLPGNALRKPWTVAIYVLILSSITALSSLSAGQPFLPAFVSQIFTFFKGLLVWTAIFIPIYLLSKRHKKTADWIMSALLIATPIFVIVLVCILMYRAFSF